MTPTAADIARLSREFALLCDASGIVRWTDERAARIIDARPGRSLAELCVPGTGSKAGELVSRAVHERVDGWELSFTNHAGTLTATFNGRPRGECALLVGHVAPSMYQTAINSRALRRSPASCAAMNCSRTWDRSGPGSVIS
jgi:hypothetical protein